MELSKRLRAVADLVSPGLIIDPKIQWTKRAESSGSTEHDRRRNGRRSYYPDTIGLP